MACGDESYKPLHKMSEKNRMAEIAKLKLKYKGRPHKVPFPDLKVEHSAKVGVMRSSLRDCCDGIGKRKSLHADAVQFPVGHSHKQGLELITPGTIKAGHLKHMGGQKS